jgi:AraC-like DNA-binding protein
MIHRILVLSSIIVTFALGSCKNDSGREYHAIDLSGKWKIIESESNLVAQPDYDDSKADEISIPGDWGYILDKNEDLAATVWIRKKITVSRDLARNFYILSLGNIAVSDQTYFNGVCIGETGGMPSKSDHLKYDFKWLKERKYQFPFSLVRFDKENVVAIKIFSHYVNGINNKPVLTTLDRQYDRSWLKDNLFPINNLYPIAMSILLVFCLIILLWESGKKIIVFNAFNIIASVTILNIVFLGLPEFESNLTRYKLVLAFYTLTEFILLLLVQQFLNIKMRYATILFTVLLIFCCAFILYAPTTKFLISYCAPVAYTLIIIYISYSCTIFIFSLLKDPRRYWLLSIIAVFLVISTADTLYCMITHKFYKMSLYLFFRLPAIFLGVIFVYLFDLKNIKKEKFSLAQALLNKSKELLYAKKVISKIEFKPEPRDIIQDVIEYIDNNYNETYDRKKLAEKFGLNEDYMCILFKKIKSTNIANYINMKRIEAAKQLLCETDVKVIDIAFHVGFDNLTYFYRNFKKNTGYSPIEYKRLCRDNPFNLKNDFSDEI